MASDDIYIQITATSAGSGRSKSVVVLVPQNAIDEYRHHATNEEDEAIARRLADPLAAYVFTHRPNFGSFRVAYAFTKAPPPEIEHEPPELTRGHLKAWLL